MKINYLTLGSDCSPAAALKDLKLREFALPFDWVVSNVNILEKCFIDNFDKFHKDLVLKHDRKRLIDYYNFEFPHDYPLNNMSNIENIKSEDTYIPEENDNHITDKWMDHYDIVLEKYNRRIERFRNIINDPNPIIVLCRYTTKDVLYLQRIFMDFYKKDNVYFVNSSTEIFKNDKIININTEKNNIWNETDIWKKGIDNFKELLNSL